MTTHRHLLFAALAACSSAPGGLPSYDEFRDLLPQVDGSYVVEGDIPIRSEAKLREYYAVLRDRADGLATTEQGLAINLVDGADDSYTDGTELHLTYCVSKSFDTTYASVVAKMAEAASRWEEFLDVKFEHKPLEDDACTNTNPNVWFDVLPGPQEGWAFAFFPHDPRAFRNIYIGAFADHTDLLSHELGHALGFRHEHGRRDSGLPEACLESNMRPITAYNDVSVMHYPSFDPICGGANTTYSIWRGDKIGAQRIYRPAVTKCSEFARETCNAQSATCEPAFSTTGLRHDLCRWGTAGTPAACEASRGGTWTAAGSGFALRWPTAVPAGAAGACITQLGNLSCSREDADKCLLHDASCERAFNLAGHRADLCRWHNDHSVATCATTDGIWTLAGSPFAIEWPTSVPSFASGACIKQVDAL